MFSIQKFLKPVEQSKALNALFGPHLFVDEHCFLCKSGAIGLVVRVKGMNDEGMRESEICFAGDRIADAWKQVDGNITRYQYVIKEKGVRVDFLDCAGSEASRRTVSARSAFLESKSPRVVDLYYALVLEPAALDGSAKKAAFARTGVRLLEGQLQESLLTLRSSAELLQSILGDFVSIELLNSGQVFLFLRRLANLNQELAASESLKYDSYVDYFMTSSPIVRGDGGLFVGDSPIEVLTLREAPRKTDANLLRDLLRIDSDFVLCTQFEPVAADVATAEILKGKNFFVNKRKNPNAAASLQKAITKKDEVEGQTDESASDDANDLSHMQKRMNAGEHLGKFSFTVVLFGHASRAAARLAALEFIKLFGSKEGSLLRESYTQWTGNALSAYLAIIPGNRRFDLRRIWLLSGNYAHMSFYAAPASGAARCDYLGSDALLALTTRDGTLCYLDRHYGDVPHMLVFGMTGAGKSVLLNLLVDHEQKRNPFTFVLDVGGGFRKLTDKHNGSYLDTVFGKESSFRMNPFSLLPSANNYQFLTMFVSLLMSGADGKRVSSKDEQELFDGIKGMCENAPSDSRTLSNLSEGLPPHLKDKLKPWVAGGQYGTIFDHAEDTLTMARFQAFDFQGLAKDYPVLLGPLQFYLFGRFDEVVLDKERTDPVLLVVDEAAVFLANAVAREYFISAAKRWRKHNAGVILATQSPADLVREGVFDVLTELCPRKLLLPSPDADFEKYAQMFHLSAEQVKLFRSLQPKRQLLEVTPQSCGVRNVDIDPVALQVYIHSNGRKSATRQETPTI